MASAVHPIDMSRNDAIYKYMLELENIDSKLKIKDVLGKPSTDKPKIKKIAVGNKKGKVTPNNRYHLSAFDHELLSSVYRDMNPAEVDSVNRVRDALLSYDLKEEAEYIVYLSEAIMALNSGVHASELHLPSKFYAFGYKKSKVMELLNNQLNLLANRKVETADVRM